VDQPDGVVGEQGVGASGDFAVMAYVVGGVGGTHPADVVVHGDALIWRGEHPQPESLPQGWLAYQHDRERRSGVHVVVG